MNYIAGLFSRFTEEHSARVHMGNFVLDVLKQKQSRHTGKSYDPGLDRITLLDQTVRLIQDTYKKWLHCCSLCKGKPVDYVGAIPLEHFTGACQDRYLTSWITFECYQHKDNFPQLLTLISGLDHRITHLCPSPPPKLPINHDCSRLVKGEIRNDTYIKTAYLPLDPTNFIEISIRPNETSSAFGKRRKAWDSLTAEQRIHYENRQCPETPTDI